MKKKTWIFYQFKIISVVSITVVSILFLHIILYTEIEENKEVLIKNWSEWQNRIIRSEMETAIASGDIEGYILQTALSRIEIKDASYSMFYKDEKVIYEKDSQTTDKYKGQNIRQVYGIFSYEGGSHLEEVLIPMENGLSGNDYFEKSYHKGKEQVTWLCFHYEGADYVLGMATSHNYILSIDKFQHKVNLKYAIAHIFSFILILFSALICFDTYKNTIFIDRAEERKADLIKVNTRLKNSLLTLEQRFEQLSIMDYLTNVYNRKFLDILLTKLESEVFYPLSIALVDINEFSLINRTYGYLKGDEILVAVADVIKKHCIDEDVIARYGADEFAIVMINTTREKANEKLNKIASFISSNYNEYSLEISFDIVTHHRYEEDIYQVIDLMKEGLKS